MYLFCVHTYVHTMYVYIRCMHTVYILCVLCVCVCTTYIRMCCTYIHWVLCLYNIHMYCVSALVRFLSIPYYIHMYSPFEQACLLLLCTSPDLVSPGTTSTSVLPSSHNWLNCFWAVAPPCESTAHSDSSRSLEIASSVDSMWNAYVHTIPMLIHTCAHM